MPSLPTGTITFLFTDLEGSTKLWEAYTDLMPAAVARHDTLLRQAVHDNSGYLFKTTGDGIAAAFAVASDGLAAALAAQQALLAEPWPEATPLRSRMGLHTGAAELREGDYFGPALNRCARLMAAGQGGQTLLSDVTQELTRDSLPPDALLLPLGDHRLKDLARPEKIYQLAHPALLADFPPLRTLDVTPNNLPQQLTSFVGREKPLAEVAALLAKTRLLTLTGSGGSGKTRLSLQAAADALDHYPDGVWLVELAALSEASLVPQTVAATFGVREQMGQSLMQTLTDFLKSKHILLVLDNCEHLIGACATLVATLLRTCSQIKAMATSREPLGIAGEITYRVPSLTLPDPKQKRTLESLSQYEAVRLFIERAQSVKPDFAITNANAPSLAQLCYHLDGIPLAIELAAARVRSLPVEQINDKLDSRFRLLTGGDRSALPRQQTLRALIDWSYDLLTENEKTLLARLSVFAGGWTLEAAEAVCAFDPIEDWEALDLLTSLVDKSLVLANEEGEAGQSRYRMLETVRQYAAERLSASEDDAKIVTKHRGYFVALAERAEPQLTGSEQGMWLNRLEIEHDNFRATLDTCAAGLDNGASAETSEMALSGLRLSSALWRFWWVHGHVSAGREQLARALTARRFVARDGASEDVTRARTAVAAALRAGGVLAWGQGDYAVARSLNEESLSLYREIEDKGGIANVLGSLGLVADGQGDYVAARLHYEESLKIYQAIGDKGGIARTLSNLGVLAFRQDDIASARSLYEENLTLYREIGYRAGIAGALGNLGLVAYRQGDYARAQSLYEENLSLCREIGDKNGIAHMVVYLGIIAYGQGDNTTARSLYEESLSLRREIGDKSGIANTLGNLGNIDYRQGDYAAARSLYEESLGIYHEVGDKNGIARTQSYLGNIAYRQGDRGTAWSLHKESLSRFREIGDKTGIAYVLDCLASVRTSEGDARQAVVLWAAADALRESIGAPLLPVDRTEQEGQREQIRSSLSKQDFGAAWDEGHALSWEQAVEWAINTANQGEV